MTTPRPAANPKRRWFQFSLRGLLMNDHSNDHSIPKDVRRHSYRMAKVGIAIIFALGFLYLTGVPGYWLHGKIATANLKWTEPASKFPGDPSPSFLAHYEYPGGDELPTIWPMPPPRSIEVWMIPGGTGFCLYTRWTRLIDLLISFACLIAGFAVAWIGERVIRLASSSSISGNSPVDASGTDTA